MRQSYRMFERDTVTLGVRTETDCKLEQSYRHMVVIVRMTDARAESRCERTSAEGSFRRMRERGCGWGSWRDWTPPTTEAPGMAPGTRQAQRPPCPGRPP